MNPKISQPGALGYVYTFSYRSKRSMQSVWGIIMAAIGLLMLIGGLTKTDFFLYRILANRSRVLWGDHVHSFYVVSGLMVAAFGILIALGYIHR